VLYRFAAGVGGLRLLVLRAYVIAITVSETACGETSILLLNFIKVI